MTQIVAIADDLTGAADCAAACAARGITATVVLHSSAEEPTTWPDAQIVSFDADTRCLSAERAAETTGELVRLQRKHAADAVLFKKVDSTLRGNLAAELSAVLPNCGRKSAADKQLSILLAPSLPAQGRTTVGGRLMVHGMPLHETDLWKNEVRESRSEIAAHLADANLSSRLIDIAAVRSGLDRLRAEMKQRAAEADVVVCDAETDDDLGAIALAAVGVGEFGAWSGSAGLASHLAQALAMESSDDGRPCAQFATGPTLFVVGSAASITREQAQELAAEAEVVTVLIEPARLEAENEVKRILDGLRLGRDVLMMLSDERCVAGEKQYLTQALSKQVVHCADIIGGLVATGGETARATLDTLGIRRLRLLGEVEAGLAVSITDGWSRSLPVLTKAGAFGSRDTLVRCRNFLRRLERGSTGQAKTPSLLREC